MTQLVLQEYAEFNFAPEIIESNNAGDKPIVRLKGIFQKGGVPNGNKRVYPTRLLTREVERLSTYINERRMIGEIDHPPGEIKPRLNNASHVITSLEMRGDEMYGVLEILAKTDAGRNLLGLYESGIKLGVSSRGTGGLKPLPGGLMEVDDSFCLNTFDVVNEPSVGTAYITEGLQQNNAFRVNTLDTLKRKLYYIF